MLLNSIEHTVTEVKLFNRNLVLISKNEKEGLHKSKFLTSIDGESLDIEFIIKSLENYDLIETETDPNVYFLTPSGYDFVEKEGFFFVHVDENEEPEEETTKEEYIVGKNDDEETLDHQIDKKEKSSFMDSFGNKMIFLAVFITVFILVWRYFNPGD